jgi:hypothetical protein
MKKILFFFGMVFLVSSVFAQENWEYNRRNAVAFNPGALIVGATVEGYGIGLSYEHSFTTMFSVKANGYFLGHEAGKGHNSTESRINGFTSTGIFALEGRFYPLSHYLEGLFFGGGFQYHVITGTVAFYDYYAGIDRQFHNTYSTVSFFTGLGYKVVFGKKRIGVSLEPTIDYIWSFYSNIPYEYRDDIINHSAFSLTAMGIKGIRFGFQIGVAF